MNAITALPGGGGGPQHNPSDARIIAAVRAGHVGDFALLRRRHAGPARRAARAIAPTADVDAMVDEAFATILHVTRAGGGPPDAVRPYLLAVLGRAAASRVRGGGGLATATSDAAPVAGGDPFSGIAERSSVAAVFATLPPDYRTLLWYLDVERMRSRELAPLMGLSPDAVSALASQARDGFRRAWLDAHLDDPARPEECRWFGEHVVATSVAALSASEAERFRAHVAGCPACQVVVAEIDTLSRRLRSILPAVLIGGAAAGRYLRLASARQPTGRRGRRRRTVRSSQ